MNNFFDGAGAPGAGSGIGEFPEICGVLRFCGSCSAPRTAMHAEREEAAMPNCPECDNALDIEIDEMEEGDVVACEECGSEFEVVGVEPLELARMEEEIEEEEDLFNNEEEEEE